jgi:hypothetical protein
LSAEELLRCLRVPAEPPLLVRVVHALRGMLDIGLEHAAIAKMDSYEKAHYCGVMAGLGEAMERIGDLVEQANKAVMGAFPPPFHEKAASRSPFTDTAFCWEGP